MNNTINNIKNKAVELAFELSPFDMEDLEWAVEFTEKAGRHYIDLANYVNGLRYKNDIYSIKEMAIWFAVENSPLNEIDSYLDVAESSLSLSDSRYVDIEHEFKVFLKKHYSFVFYYTDMESISVEEALKTIIDALKKEPETVQNLSSLALFELLAENV